MQNARVMVGRTVQRLMGLPRPEQRPGALIVIFDHRCKLCTESVRRLKRWDGNRRLAFLPLDDPDLARWPELDRRQLEEAIHLVDGEGRIHRGAAAFRILALRLPRLWLLAPLLYIPGSLPLWNWLYRQVAGQRHRLARKT